MATVITEECINCGACEPECPNTAIYQGGTEYEWQGGMHAALSPEFFYIVPEKCTECVGFFDQEACAAVCPVDCCVPDPNRPESEADLFVRAKEIHPDREFPADYPSRFKEGAGAAFGAAPGEGQTAPAVAAPAPAPAGAPAAATAVVSAPSMQDVDVPVPCRSCGGEFEVNFRFLTPGTVLRCPHCGLSSSPTQQMYVLVSNVIERYATALDNEIDRHTAALEQERKRFEKTTGEFRQSVDREVREIVDRVTEPPRRSIFG